MPNIMNLVDDYFKWYEKIGLVNHYPVEGDKEMTDFDEFELSKQCYLLSEQHTIMADRLLKYRFRAAEFIAVISVIAFLSNSLILNLLSFVFVGYIINLYYKINFNRQQIGMMYELGYELENIERRERLDKLSGKEKKD